MGVAEHVVQFYEADASFVQAAADFIGAGLRAGEVGLVVVTPAHRADLEQRLRAECPDLLGRYEALDAAETLARLMADGLPDPVRFADVIGGLVARAAVGDGRVRIVGEMVALLAAAGNHAATLRLEELWNRLQATHPFALLCAYPVAQLDGQALAGVFGDVCARHTRI